MKLTQQVEAGLHHAYNELWAANLSADMKTFASYIVDDFSNFGSANGEIFFTKDDIVNFYAATADQMKDKAQLRNRNISVQALDENNVVIRETSNLYVLIGDIWTFYGFARISCVFKRMDKSWKAVHQHVSFPDHRTEEGQQGAVEAIEKENLELREAVRRRTIELEDKTRELEIEASLERIRTTAMSMQQPEDLLKISEILFKELQAVGFQKLRNALIHTFNDEEKYFTDYDYSEFTGGCISRIPYSGHPAIDKFIKEVRSSNDAFTEITISGKELEDWREFRKSNNEAPDTRLDETSALYYYFYSVGPADIGLSTLKSISVQERELLKRYRNVFDLAYRRYLDIEQAIAQTREAQIEAALEKVRSRSLAMHQSDELNEVVATVFEKLKDLHIPATAVGISLPIENSKDLNAYVCGEHETGLVITNYRLPFFDNVISNDLFKALQNKLDLFVGSYSKEEKNSFYQYLFENSDIKQVPEDIKSMILQSQAYTITMVAVKHALFNINDFEGKNLTAHEVDVIKRFANVFDQAYTRFLDLQKAEAQAREGQIELALERVRAGTMAMHKSEEVMDVAGTLFQELKKLGFAFGASSIIIMDKISGDAEYWMAGFSKEKFPESYRVKYFQHTYHDALLHAWKTGKKYIIYHLAGDEKKAYDEVLFSQTGYKNIPEEELKLMRGIESVTFSIAFMKHGALHWGPTLLNEEQANVLQRFAKVFEQSYTRFLDLQKAEAQAREAQVESALERVRSRSLAMHHTSEIQSVIHAVHNELLKLNISIYGGSFIVINKDVDDGLYAWGAGATAETTTKMLVPHFGMSFCTNLFKGIKTSSGFFTEEFSRQQKIDYFTELFNHKPWSEIPVEDKKNTLESDGAYTRSVSVLDNTTIFIVNQNGRKFTAEENDILRRFSKVFEQSYVRFLDLQKAEAQAREAEIELALERVRARTLAMQKSNELADVSVLLDAQVRALGIRTWGCAFNIYDNDESSEWFSSEAGTLPVYKTPRENIFLRYYEGGQRGELLHIQEFDGEDCATHYEYLCTVPIMGDALKQIRADGGSFPTRQIDHVAYFKYGYLLFITLESVPEAHEIFKRFAKVFEQTYTRFLDLQKAEAQAREAQINLAVERVRAKALAMRRSEEIMEVVAKLKDEVMGLNIPDVVAATIFLNEGEDKVRMWDLTSIEILEEGYQVPLDITFKLKTKDPYLYVKRVWENTEDYFVEIQDKKGFKRIIAWLRKHDKNHVADEVEAYVETSGLERLYHAAKRLNNGKLVIDLLEPPSAEMETILTKMGAAFDLAYKRFEDLRNAEAQSKEAQIELSLERIRAKVTAMQRSTDLLDIVVTMRREFVSLGHQAHYFWHMRWQPNTYEKAMTSGDGTRIGMVMELPRGFHNNPAMTAWEDNSEPYAVFALDVDSAIDYVDQMVTTARFSEIDSNAPGADAIRSIGGLTFVMARTTHGEIGYSLPGVVPNPSAEDLATLVRFATVFDLAYRRFEDLQSSEKRIREAQIELAIERVRAQTLAMQKSEELAETASLLFHQVKGLDINVYTAGFTIWEEESENLVSWACNADGSMNPPFPMPYKENDWHYQQYQSWKNGEDFIVKDLDGEAMMSYFQYLRSFPLLDEAFKTSIAAGHPMPERQVHNVINFSQGNLLFITHVPVPDAHDIFKRFGKVFEQTYTRFLDLQKAEAATKEAVKQASLDRIRADIASMRTSNDLEKITPLIWNELTILGVPFIRCGVFIMNDAQQLIHTYLSTPEGKAVAAFQVPYQTGGNVSGILKSWQQNTIYLEHWNEKDFADFVNKLIEQGSLASFENYLNTVPKGGIYLHCVPFLQGMFYVGSATRLWEKEVKLIQSVADAFSTAYARYEDFNKLEAAKKQVDITLMELKAAQKQLIQSEKMASLGELTAGIAHEIQNPLNFVNNFSEVSKELLDEMTAAVESGNTEEAKQISSDIIQNLEKIGHHGKRADAIIKGMLQHSRSSSNQREPTDINALADEYLRLASHGLRAKDRFFNATLKTDYDTSIRSINIVPQDIGRVLLNLISNAFYAVDERKRTASPPSKGGISQKEYEPTVSVTTSLNPPSGGRGAGVIITVSDNGNGIPQNIIDKIFQPFFTTKPTGQGTGLGLSLAYDIVKAHGGELKVETTYEEGSTFVVELPNQ